MILRLTLTAVMALNLFSCDSTPTPSTTQPSLISAHDCVTEILPGGTGSITLQGTLTYADKHYDSTGFTGKTQILPVRFTRVELLDSNNAVVSRHASNQTGHYQLQAPKTGNYRLRILTQTHSPCYDLDIQLHDLDDDLMAVTQAVNLTAVKNTRDIFIENSHSLAGAFNILDVYTTATEFILHTNSQLPPALKVYWSPGKHDKGTYYCLQTDLYCPHGPGIYVLSGASYEDTDEFDDDVLWHEYGHFVAEKYAQDNSEGGQHGLRQNNLDLRLAFSEGWGNFFPLAIKHWLLATNPNILSLATSTADNIYVDTSGSSGWSYDFSIPPASPYIYASNEVAVTSLLKRWQTDYGFEQVWRVMTDHLQHINTPTNLEAFWDGWLTLHAPSGEAFNALQQQLVDREIFYQADKFEPDDTLRNNTPELALCLTTSSAGCQTDQHTLYGNDDEDSLRLQLRANTQYSIKTLNLHNGADTFLTLIETATQTVVAENDNALSLSGLVDNDSTSLSSFISYTPPQDGQYEVKIKTSANKPNSAGRYGDYVIQLLSK